MIATSSPGFGPSQVVAARAKGIAAAMILAGLVAGCSYFESDQPQSASAPPPPESELAPAPKPLYEPGDTFVFNDDGTIVQEQVVSVTPDRITWTNDQGLIWATTNELVTPPLTWSSHPELGRGRQTVIGDPGALFPLQEGNVVAFSVRGNSETVPAGWQDENRCVVSGQEDVTVAAGTYTAFRVDCQRTDFTESLYYSPVAQNYVLRERAFPNGATRKELVSVSLASNRTESMPAVASGAPSAAPTMAVHGTDTMGHGKDAMAKDSMATDTMSMSPDQRMAMLVNRLERVVNKLETMPAGAAAHGASGDAMEKAAMSMKDNGHNAGGGGGHSGKYGVHLASYRSSAAARRGWTQLKGRYPSELGDLDMETTEYDPGDGRGTFIRLVAGRFETKAAADSFCGPLKAKRQFCQGMRVAP